MSLGGGLVHHQVMDHRRQGIALVGAWLAWAVAVALAGVAVALGWRPTVGDWWLNLPLATGYPLAGAVILTSRPGHPIGRLLLGVGLGAGLAMASHQYATTGIVLDPGSLPFTSAAAWVGSWVWALGVLPVMTLLPLVLPDGRLLSRRWRPVLGVALLAIACAVLGYGFAPGRLVDFPSVHNPLGIAGLAGVTGALQGMALPFSLIATGGAVASLVMRWRGADQPARQALQHVMAAVVVFAAVVVLAGLVPLPLTVSATVQILAALLVPAAIVLGVLQRQLFDIRLVVRPSLVYASLTTSILVSYIVVVQLVGRLAGHAVGLVAATGAVAIAFQPLHRRVQRGVDRLLHGDRADPGAAVTRLVSQLSSSSEPSAVLAGVAAAVAESLQVPGVRAAAVDGERVMADATWGTFPTAVEHVPIRFYGSEVGHLELAERAPGTPLNRADRRVLERLHPHIAIAMHVVSLTAGLTAAREQAILAREEERRRIRRDLHDGLGPVLAGLGLGLEGAADLIATDPDRARDVLAELADAVHATVDDVRRLVYDLRPPALDDLGLLGAIREHANSMARRPGSVLVSLVAPQELPLLPAAVEVALYRIAVEALTNVERHAHASRCTVGIRVDDGIELTVDDDGVGIGLHGIGLGLSSMEERVRELNGIWSLEPRQPTGTHLRARLPVGAA
jgi:two-component system, NarL family, sensor kinase